MHEILICSILSDSRQLSMHKPLSALQQSTQDMYQTPTAVTEMTPFGELTKTDQPCTSNRKYWRSCCSSRVFSLCSPENVFADGACSTFSAMLSDAAPVTQANTPHGQMRACWLQWPKPQHWEILAKFECPNGWQSYTLAHQGSGWSLVRAWQVARALRIVE